MLYSSEPSDLGHYDSIYVSPHLDDAALSCAGSIRDDARAGRRALVLTLFSTDGEAAGDASSEYRERWREEEAALRELGADGLLCGLTDAPSRSLAYQGFDGIVFGRDPADVTTGLVAARQITKVIHLASPDTVYAPLGVGGHIDHRICYEAARIADLPHGTDLLFYEDRPYAFVAEAVRLRLAQLGFTSDTRDLRAGSLRELTASFFFSFFRTRYVQAYLHGARNHVASVARYTTQLRAATRAGLVEAAPLVRAFEEDVVGVAGRAIGAYNSQVTDLFGDMGAWERASLEYATRIGREGGYAERFWLLT